jgi:hypothetical protein
MGLTSPLARIYYGCMAAGWMVVRTILSRMHITACNWFYTSLDDASIRLGRSHRLLSWGTAIAVVRLGTVRIIYNVTHSDRNNYRPMLDVFKPHYCCHHLGSQVRGSRSAIRPDPGHRACFKSFSEKVEYHSFVPISGTRQPSRCIPQHVGSMQSDSATSLCWKLTFFMLPLLIIVAAWLDSLGQDGNCS